MRERDKENGKKEEEGRRKRRIYSSGISYFVAHRHFYFYHLDKNSVEA